MYGWPRSRAQWLSGLHWDVISNTSRGPLLLQKAELAVVKSTLTTQPSLQESLEAALGPDFSSAAGALGKPDVDQILECHAKDNWHRRPSDKEILVVNNARWATGSFHALRPPVVSTDGFDLVAFRSQCDHDGRKTWRGWKFTLSEESALFVWDPESNDQPDFCKRCFGVNPGLDAPSSSSSSSSS